MTKTKARKRTGTRERGGVARRAQRRAEQPVLEFPNAWGGARKGAGRKPRCARAGVPHRVRAALGSRYPVHVTMKVRAGLPSLRRRHEHRVLVEAFRGGCERGGFRLVHYSIQANHLHLIVEGRHRRALSRGLQGLAVRIARGLNWLWQRGGSVFADRYHDHVLRSPREVWNALRYVLCNARKHGGWLARDLPDPCSSARWFDGWRGGLPSTREPAPTARAHSWLLRRAWRRHGLLRVEAVPCAQSRRKWHVYPRGFLSR